MPTCRVVAWLPVAPPSVRLMARATAESAARGAELRLLSPAPPPPQWSSWRAAAASLGVSASWHVVATDPQDGVPEADGMPEALVAELARAALVVTDSTSLGAAARAQLAQIVDVYLVAGDQAQPRARMREPAVVVGVPEGPESAHLVSTAGHEAELRHRQLIVLHAQSRDVHVPDHLMERRWLDAQHLEENRATRSTPRVVLTHRAVTDALRDHVEADDVLVVGVHPPGDVRAASLESSLLEAPPCDLLLTRTTGSRTGGDPAHAPRGLNVAAQA